MPFKGRMRILDPRNLLFGWGGMVWPTVPPYRWRLGSQYATGQWLSFKTTGILLEPQPQVTSETIEWVGTDDMPAWLHAVYLRRVWIPLADYCEWMLRIISDCQYQQWDTVIRSAREKANMDKLIGPIKHAGAPPGDPGDTMTAYQVEFDERNVPGGWPPW